MALSQDDVKKVAELARIGVSDKEITQYQKDLSAVFDYFEKLQEVDTSAIDQIGHATGMTNVLRGDDVDAFDDDGKRIMQENIPAQKDGQIKVKSVL